MSFFSKAKAALNVAIHIVDRVHEVAAQKGYLPPVVEKAWNGYRETVSDWIGSPMPEEPEEWEGDSTPRKREETPKVPQEPEEPPKVTQEPPKAPQEPEEPEEPPVFDRDTQRERDRAMKAGQWVQTAEKWFETGGSSLPRFPPPDSDIDSDHFLISVNIRGIGWRSLTLRGRWSQIKKDWKYYKKRGGESYFGNELALNDDTIEGIACRVWDMSKK